FGVVPAAARHPYNYDDGRANCIFIPRFRNLAERHPKFIRGYNFMGAVQRGMMPTTAGGATGFGVNLKKQIRDAQDPPPFWMAGLAEMLPRFENRVTIDKNKKDAWGIPAVNIECTHSDNERAMAVDQMETMKEMAHAAGFQINAEDPNLAPPGTAIHDLGTARMGDDPKKSVLNKFNQSWDVKNLFVTDGASFTTGCSQAPTLTMMALTVRACDYLVDQHRKGDLV
ncbi:MAG TPA: GMC family oxidoreductase, partial [Pyrinomonadaceae bacterium]|nr:GMC family oxidoreductase [Pyrinomonadaceae bacterium]